MLYSDFRLNTQSRNELIRKRYTLGAGLSDLAREYDISPQRVYQIVNFRQKQVGERGMQLSRVGNPCPCLPAM